jgi:superfamily II DNA or RNA helicase
LLVNAAFFYEQITMSVALRSYQIEAEDGVRDAMRLSQAVLLVLCTGAGKTVIFSDIARKAALKGKRILILAHRDTLIRQASAKLMEYGVEHGIIMAGFTPNRYKLVQVASVQTLTRRLGKVKLDFDLIIIDEAHLSAAKSYRDIVDAFPRAKVLGVTGSPIRLDGKGLGRDGGGMFDAMVQGISIKDLIEQAFLVRPVVYAAAQQIDLSGVKKVGGDYDGQALAEVMDKPVITGSAIEHYKRICPGVPAVAWCANVEHSQHVAAEFNAAGVPALALSGESTTDERDRALKALTRGTIKVVTFAMLLVEGVDCPAIGAVIMLRPTMSLASYLQVIGRGLRTLYATGMPLDTIEQRLAAIKAGPKGDRCYVLDHAGLTFKHGFADEIREWSLEGMQKKKGKKKNTEPPIDLKQCPKCYLVSAPVDVCPGCGYEYPVHSRKIEQVDGELQEITLEMRNKMAEQQRLRDRSAQAAAKSVEDMMSQLGYSRGRAEAIVKAREEKAAIRTQLIFDLQAWQKQTGQAPIDACGAYISDLKAMKPKALKDLRDKFDANRLAHTGSRPGDDPELAQALHGMLMPNNFPTQGQEPAF